MGLMELTSKHLAKTGNESRIHLKLRKLVFRLSIANLEAINGLRGIRRSSTRSPRILET